MVETLRGGQVPFRAGDRVETDLITEEDREAGEDAAGRGGESIAPAERVPRRVLMCCTSQYERIGSVTSASTTCASTTICVAVKSVRSGTNAR